MSLLQDFRNVAGELGVSHLPANSEVASLLGAVVGYLEHGDKIFEAVKAGTTDLENLLSGMQHDVADQPAPAPMPAVTAPEPATVPEPAAPVDQTHSVDLSEADYKQFLDWQRSQAAQHATADQAAGNASVVSEQGS